VSLAGEVERADISFTGSTYHYAFDLKVHAPFEAVRKVITDYDHLERINDSVIQSEVIERYDERRLRRRLWLNQCVLMFCFDLYFMEEVESFDDGSIVTTVVPDGSNFRRGVSIWRVEKISDDETRIKVEAEQEPSFWIPPVIGPLVFKRTFIKEVRNTAANIEREARNVELQ
jgi:hypothetical protein